MISNRVDGLADKLDKVLREAIRTALPVYATTPTPALHREMGIPPMELILEHKTDMYATRIQRLDKRHPVRRRSSRTAGQEVKTRLARTAQKASDTESIDGTLCPPRKSPRAPLTPNQGPSKQHAADQFKNWLKWLNPLDLVVFTDGSQVDGPRRGTGAGWAIGWGDEHPVKVTGNLPMGQAEVFHAEVMGALQGLLAATQLEQARLARDI